MKTYYLKKPDYFEVALKSFRDKRDISLALIQIMKLVNTYTYKNLKTNKENADILIVVDKMSRCFLKCEGKIHTFQMPFGIVETEKEDLLFIYKQETIDSKMCALFEAFIIQLEDSENSFESMFDFFADTAKEDFEISSTRVIDYCWNIYIDLLRYESGYMRYDHDTERADPIIHPENHIDFFYSSNCTFKLGLDREIDVETLKEIVNISETCYYININSERKID